MSLMNVLWMSCNYKASSLIHKLHDLLLLSRSVNACPMASISPWMDLYRFRMIFSCFFNFLGFLVCSVNFRSFITNSLSRILWLLIWGMIVSTCCSSFRWIALTTESLKTFRDFWTTCRYYLRRLSTNLSISVEIVWDWSCVTGLNWTFLRGD